MEWGVCSETMCQERKAKNEHEISSGIPFSSLKLSTDRQTFGTHRAWIGRLQGFDLQSGKVYIARW